MSSTEQLFGFDLIQKKSLAEYLAANGGGGGNTLGGLPVTPGFIGPLANGDLFVVFQGGDGLFVTNYPSATVVNGQTQAFLEAIPGWNGAAEQTLQNLNGVITWVTNP